MEKFIGYQVTANHHTNQKVSQVSALTTQEEDTPTESRMGGKTESIKMDSSDQALSNKNISQSPALLLTTMDSNALDCYVRSLPYSQRKENAEKWETTTRHSRNRAKKCAPCQQSESSRDTPGIDKLLVTRRVRTTMTWQLTVAIS